MHHPLITNRLLVTSLIVSVLIVFIGIFSYAKSLPLFWNEDVLMDFAGWIACCLLAAGIIKQRFKTTAHLIFLAVVGAYFVFGVGLEQSASVTLFTISSILYGKIILRLVFPRNINRIIFDTYLIIGFAFQLAIFGALIHFELNYRWVYLLILSAPLFLAFISTAPAQSRKVFLGKTNALKLVFAEVSYWHFITMVSLAAAVARYTFFPSIGADDNALHLGMWTQLTHRGIYGFDVATQIWSVAPFAVDILHSIVSLIAGDDARSALNLLILTLLLRQIWLICGHLSLKSSDRLLVIVLFASTPMLGNLLVTLQTELYLAFLVTSGVWLLLNLRGGQIDERYIAILAVAAMCSATKLPGLLLGALLVVATALVTFSNYKTTCLQKIMVRPIWALIFIFMMVFVALNSYATAWKITGNPLFPLYNAIFRSQYFPYENFSDIRYITGFSLKSYWNVFFNTSRYFESKDFVAGFQYLLLLPIALITMLWKESFKHRIIFLLPLIGFGVAMFSATQYWRYIFPILPLATIVIGTLLASESLALATTTRVCVGIYIAINFYFFPGVSWFFIVEPQRAYTSDGRKEIARQIAPAKMLTSFLNEYPYPKNPRVLYSAENFGATLKGNPIYATWYSPNRQARIGAVRQLDDIATIVKDENIDFVIWDVSILPMENDPRWLLREYLSKYGLPERQIGSHILYRLTKLSVPYREIFNSISNTENTAVSSTPLLVGRSAIRGGSVARYHVNFKCNDPNGFFIALVSFDVGAPYYRSIPCSLNSVKFTESFIIPLESARADVYSTTLDSSGAIAEKVTLETY